MPNVVSSLPGSHIRASTIFHNFNDFLEKVRKCALSLHTPRGLSGLAIWNLVTVYGLIVASCGESGLKTVDSGISSTVFFRWNTSVIFCWNISVICLTVVLKLTMSMFFRLYCQTFIPKWLNFSRSFQKRFCLWPKKKQLQYKPAGPLYTWRSCWGWMPYNPKVIIPG